MKTLHRITLIALFAFGFTLSQPGFAREIKIQVAVTGDVHARLFPYDFLNDRPAATSMANVHYLMEAVRTRQGNNLILLDNGDLLQGTPAAYYANFVQESDKNLFARVMNLMKYDAATIGNHDIEAGPQVYNRLVEEFDFPWLAANVLDSETGEPYFKPYTIITRQRVRIAVLGLTTTGVPNWLPPHLWEGMVFQDMAEAASYWVPYILENEQPDALIGLFHSGMGPLYPDPSEFPLENASGHVARTVPGFDLIFTAHDHRQRVHTVINQEGGEVLLLGAGHFAENLAVAELSFTRLGRRDFVLEDVRGEMVPTAKVVPSHTFINTFEKDVQEIIAFSNETIGQITRPMHSIEALFGSAPFTDLVHEIQLRLTAADISFTAPLAFDETIPAGPLRMRDLFRLYEYENYLYTMELSGQEITDYLEYSYGLWFNEMSHEGDHLLNLHRDQRGRVPSDRRGRHALRNPAFNFDSAAGIRYQVDVSRPVGSRVSILEMQDGEVFDPAATYRVAINSYRGSGGGGHLTEGAGIARETLSERIVATTENDLRSEMIGYFREMGEVVPESMDNWEVVPREWKEKGKNKDLPYLRP